jgi:hypothetical protein
MPFLSSIRLRSRRGSHRKRSGSVALLRRQTQTVDTIFCSLFTVRSSAPGIGERSQHQAKHGRHGGQRSQGYLAARPG